MKQINHEQDGEQGSRLEKAQSEKQLDTPRTRKKASISGVDCVRGKLGQGTGEVESKDQMKEILLRCDKNVPFI